MKELCALVVLAFVGLLILLAYVVFQSNIGSNGPVTLINGAPELIIPVQTPPVPAVPVQEVLVPAVPVPAVSIGEQK